MATYSEKPTLLEIVDLKNANPFWTVNFGGMLYYSANQDLLCKFCHRHRDYYMYTKTKTREAILYCLRPECMQKADVIISDEERRRGLKILTIEAY